MTNAMQFASWFLEKVPEFLLAEPIVYFVGVGLMLWTLGFVIKIINIK